MATYGYGNNRGGYRGQTLKEMIEVVELAAEKRCEQLSEILTDLIGTEDYEAWADHNQGSSWCDLKNKMERKVDEIHKARIAQDLEQ